MFVASLRYVLLLACALLTCEEAVFAQPAGSQKARAKVTESVTTPDGWKLPITYYAVYNKEAPVVLMLQSTAGGRVVWDKLLAEELWQKAGVAVLTVDLRKQGKAEYVGSGRIKPGGPQKQDFDAMATIDLETVKGFIFKEHQQQHLNMRKLTVIADGELAAVAMAWTVFDWSKPPYNDAPTVAMRTPRGQDVQALVLLSPPQRAGTRMNTKTLALSILRAGWPIHVLVVYGTEDRLSKEPALDIFETLSKASDAEKRIFKREFNTKRRGVDLLAAYRSELVPPITVLINKHVREIDAPWRDRQSNLLK